jgi:site-specific DNA-methyltransferase (adenine-specific)
MRFDLENQEVRDLLLPLCRLQPGDIWADPVGRHVVGCGDCCSEEFRRQLSGAISGYAPTLAVHDPPYNVAAFERRPVKEYTEWCRAWVEYTYGLLADDASLYVWLGADQTDHFQPLPQFMTMMAHTGFAARSFITMRNQRGYGTQQNWMAARQELLYYTKGTPLFRVQYTEIPKTLRGYYKEVGGQRLENIERSKSDTIRAGNVWIDIQQVFYRMEENVPGCYAQKPLKAIERIISASSNDGDIVLDFFAHSGTTLLACERLKRRCLTCDIDPVCAEITIRRLERYRATGKLGWQRQSPFESPKYPDSAEAPAR